MTDDCRCAYDCWVFSRVGPSVAESPFDKPLPFRPESEWKPLICPQKLLGRLPIDLSDLQEFDHINTSFPCLALREKRTRSPHPFGDFLLGHTRSLPRCNQSLKKTFVDALVRCRPCPSRFARLGFLRLCHPSSVWNT